MLRWGTDYGGRAAAHETGRRWHRRVLDEHWTGTGGTGGGWITAAEPPPTRQC
ncbi:MAG: hypothetical protein IJK41_01735 [Muribaculaceae bacterium]|nr:hypothetical protein [Muribaculaceae bacterium]